MIPVEGHKNLYRDEKTEREELDRMKSDIEEIKFLLKEIINR
jgi:hypothetical protein